MVLTILAFNSLSAQSECPQFGSVEGKCVHTHTAVCQNVFIDSTTSSHSSVKFLNSIMGTFKNQSNSYYVHVNIPHFRLVFT